MDNLLMQNQRLQKNIENHMQEIEKQKELNAQHENQIQTLLKFNQRLLEIIENQLGNNKKDNCSLQPISERSQRQSDLFGGMNTFNSLIKSKKLVARSEWGGTKQSLIERAHMINRKKQFQEQNQQHSLYLKDEVPNTPTRSEIGTAFEVSKKIAEGNTIKNEMQEQIRQFKKFNSQSNAFYSSKIDQIKSLSKRISNYNPMDELKKITSKINISSQTNDLIKNRINKKS